LKRAFLLEVSTVLNIGFDGGFYLRELVSIFEQELMVKLLTSNAQFWIPIEIVIGSTPPSPGRSLTTCLLNHLEVGAKGSQKTQ
jgi:hypothetical protein